ncbi:V-type proton ATPase subunit S1-like [Prorops nasuta]|uniref:V-type proton ATPase subunit S1-like n=1 Tax=Prorops nasuta TaxID=863751 RepID=UPI0034CEC348
MAKLCLTYFHTLGLIISQFLAFSYAGDAVPVLLWGGSSVPGSNAANPLVKTSRVDFERILSTKLGKTQSPLLVFVKDSFCVEDITQHKESLQQATNGELLTYLTAVETPLNAFEDLPLYNQTSKEEIDSISEGHLVFMPVIDLDAISEMYKEIKESTSNVVAAVTGKYCSYSRSERIKRAVGDNNQTAFIIHNDKVLFYCSQPPSFRPSENESWIQLDKLTSSDSQDTNKQIILRTQFSTQLSSLPKLVLEFNFTFHGGYYSLKNVKYRPNATAAIPLVTKTDISFPSSFSYHCSPNITFSVNSTALILSNFQVQIYANSSFGDVYDCVGFTSIPIWMGIFVTAILALIMIWALTMIIDIRTMDRFDDPKGKTITITGVE